MQEIQVQSLAREEPLEEEMVTYINGNIYTGYWKWQPVLMVILQYSCLGKLTDRGTWQAIVHRVTESQTRLGDYTAAAAPWRPI